MKRSLPLAFFCLLILQLSVLQSSAQHVKYLPKFPFPIRSSDNVQIIGQLGSSYYLYYAALNADPQVIKFNNDGLFEKAIPLPFINASTLQAVNLFAENNELLFIVQSIVDRKLVLTSTVLDSTGTQVGATRELDATPLASYGSSALYKLVTTEDRNKFLAYRIVSGFSTQQVLFEGIVLNEVGKEEKRYSNYLPLEAELETVSAPYLAPGGELFVAVHDIASNYKLGTKVKLYYVNGTSEGPKFAELYIKQYKPIELLFDWNAGSKQLAIGSVYQDFYTKNVEGVLAGFWTPGKKVWDTIITHDIDKKYKKDLKSGVYSIPFTEVTNTLQLRYFKVLEKGSIMFVGDLYNNFSMYRGTINNGLTNPSQRNSLARTGTSQQQPVTPVISTARGAGERVGAYNPTASSIATQNAADRARQAAMLNNNTQSPSLQAAGDNFQPKMVSVPSFAMGDVSPRDAGNVLLFNKMLDYKTVLIYTDTKTKVELKKWVRNLYVPGSPFTNVLLLPDSEKSFKVLNYEINGKNIPYLQSSSVSVDRTSEKSTVVPGGMPFLFFKKNIAYTSKRSLLTLYHDAENNLTGLATIQW